MKIKKWGFNFIFATVASMLLVDLSQAAPVMTRFRPEVHGFKFANTFSNDFVPQLDIRTGGLCGGMAAASLDYFFANRAIPNQDYRPANSTILQSYLYNRQVDSIKSHLDKWTELGVNPGGARNTEFFNWGLQAGVGKRITELRAHIDAGRPVAIGLQEAGTGSHQVVAVGYDLGRYRGDLGNFKTDFKIFVYDNNHPNELRTLVPDVNNQVYTYLESDETWRTYFVQTNYAPKIPPALPNAVYARDGKIYELLLHFYTGNDDLRGGNDNVNISLRLKSGAVQNFANVNLGGRWLSNYEETVRVVLRTPVLPADLATLTVLTTFSGGPGGDNWDMKRLSIRGFGGNVNKTLKEVGFKRFTGSDKNLAIDIGQGAEVPAGFANRVNLWLKTGDDDLRGGNDNYNVTVFFRDGTNQVFNNVNGSGRYPDRTEQHETLNLNRVVKPDQITRIVMQTTFSGGMGGDNWNMNALEIRAIGPDINTKIGTSGFKRFTASDRTLSISTSPMP